MKRKAITKSLALAVAVTAGLALVQPAPAEADWFSSTWHKAKHAAKKASHTASHTAKKAGHAIEKGAKKAGHDIKKGAEKTGQAIKMGAEETGRGIETGAKYTAAEIEKGAKAAAVEMGKLEGQLTQLTGHCQTAVDKFGHSVNSAMPRSRTNTNVPQMRSAKCDMAMTSGFMCGIFPYANGIVKSIAEGAHDMKALGNHVHRAYDSHACSRLSKLDPNRSVCALFVGLAEKTAESVECIAGVANELSKEKGARKQFDETPVCHFAGNVMFGFVADRLALANVAEENRKVVRFAQMLRTALAVKRTAAGDDIVKRVPA